MLFRAARGKLKTSAERGLYYSGEKKEHRAIEALPRLETNAISNRPIFERASRGNGSRSAGFRPRDTYLRLRMALSDFPLS